MAGGIERQIFEDAGQPEDDSRHLRPSTTPPVDQAVDDAIREMERADAPPARARPATGQPARLEDVDDKSNAGLLQALLDERDRRQDTARSSNATRRRSASARPANRSRPCPSACSRTPMAP